MNDNFLTVGEKLHNIVLCGRSGTRCVVMQEKWSVPHTTCRFYRMVWTQMTLHEVLMVVAAVPFGLA